MTTATGFDFEAIQQGIERLDAEALIELYADDAELRSVNRHAQPRSPEILRGKTAIARHLRDVCSQNIKAEVTRQVFGDDGMAYLLSLEYPDGRRLMCATLLEVSNGKIAKEVGIQAWDE